MGLVGTISALHECHLEWRAPVPKLRRPRRIVNAKQRTSKSLRRSNSQKQPKSYCVHAEGG